MLFLWLCFITGKSRANGNVQQLESLKNEQTLEKDDSKLGKASASFPNKTTKPLKIMLGRSFTLKGKDNEDRGEVETVPELSPHIIEKS